MTQKPRKGDIGELKSKKNSWGSMPQTSVEVGNRSVFILDPHLEMVIFHTRRDNMLFSRMKTSCSKNKFSRLISANVICFLLIKFPQGNPH